MTSKTAFWKWSLIGALAAVILVVGQASAVGGLSGLLHVGEASAVRPLIESELGDVPLAANHGHDGQIYYAIGLDLLGRNVPDLLDHGAYRYRRVLYPLIATGFGLLDGDALLVGMIAVVILSTGIAAGTTAAIATQLKRSDWLALVVLLNPGIWLSVRLLTPDAAAMALMLVGLYTVLVGNRYGIIAFGLSGLAKEVYLTTAVGIAVSRDRRRWIFALIPGAVLAAWVTWLTLTMGEGFSGRGNITWPFMGIIEASSVWGTFHTADLFYLVFALVTVAAGLTHSFRSKRWLRWPILGWSILAVISSNWVWDLGNNAARAFAPLAVLIALSYAVTGSVAERIDREMAVGS